MPIPSRARPRGGMLRTMNDSRDAMQLEWWETTRDGLYRRNSVPIRKYAPRVLYLPDEDRPATPAVRYWAEVRLAPSEVTEIDGATPEEVHAKFREALAAENARRGTGRPARG